MAVIEGKVENNEFLLKFKNTPKLRDLCRTMKIGSYQADEVIITEGEVGDRFYILYMGEVSISKGQKQQVLKGKIIQVSVTSLLSLTNLAFEIYIETLVRPVPG